MEDKGIKGKSKGLHPSIVGRRSSVIPFDRYLPILLAHLPEYQAKGGIR